MNFVRMWMRPSDGMFSSQYVSQVGEQPINKAVLDLRNTDFTVRLHDILDAASRNANGVVDNGLIVEVMLWDTSTQWHAANLVSPTSWATCFTDPNPANCPNIHHPANHVKSLADLTPIDFPNDDDLLTDVGKLEGSPAAFWFNTDPVDNAAWIAEQRAYMAQVMDVVSQFDNVTVEVINEAGRDGFNDGSVDWRIATHSWLAETWPGFVYQSQSYAGTPRVASDEAVRAFGAQDPSAVSMVSTHWLWTYYDAQDVYHQYGVLPGCNEGDFPGGTSEFQVKQTAWGITMGGGAFSVEELWPGHPNGPWGDLATRLMDAIGRFFEPANDPDRPAFWTMSPQKNMVVENATAATHYVLANGTADILIMSENDDVFHVPGLGAHRYRWFTFNGSNYVWGAWNVKDVWEFSPPAGDWVGLQIKPFGDFPTVSIDSASVNFSVSETGSASVTINRSGELNLTSTVHFSTAPGTATSPADFTSVSQNVTFAPGESVQWVNVPIAGDGMDESDETFTVTISSGSQSGVGTAQGTITIADNDDPPALSISDTSVTEGNSGTTNAVFTVTLTPASGRPVSVNWKAEATGTAAAGADFTPATGTLNFAAGETSKSVQVAVVGDTLDEAPETFSVTLFGQSDATLPDGVAIGTIQDNDPEPALSISDTSVTEGNSGTTNAVFTVTLTPASGRPVSVNWRTETSGTAVAGADFTPATGALNFAAGETSKSVQVAVVGDTLDEAPETFHVTLYGQSDASLSDGAAIGTIQDNDPEPALEISDAGVEEGNSGTTNAVFTVTLMTASGQTVYVGWSTAPGTGAADVEFLSASGTLTFAPGETLKSVPVAVVGDTSQEAEHTFFVNLGQAVHASILDPQGEGRIGNDDGRPTISIQSSAVIEHDSGLHTWQFTVTLSAPSDFPVGASYVTTNLTADAGDHQIPASGTLDFPPGSSSQVVQGAVVGDASPEQNETIQIDLTGTNNATIGVGQAIGTILDDEPADYFTVTPCRLLDTRVMGRGPLPAGSTRLVPGTGSCGVPSTAKAIAVIVTSVLPTDPGFLSLFPAHLTPPETTTIDFKSGAIRSNNAVVTLGGGGQVSVKCGMATGTTHFVIDVYGYFQ